jgi:hypothetical protein
MAGGGVLVAGQGPGADDADQGIAGLELVSEITRMSRTRRPDGGRAGRPLVPQQATRQGPDAGLARPDRAEGWCVPPRSGRLRGPAGTEQG